MIGRSEFWYEIFNRGGVLNQQTTPFMKQFVLFVALLCGCYNLQAQAYIPTVDSTTKVIGTTSTVVLDFPFIGIIKLENLSSAFQQITIPFQIPVSNRDSNELSYPEVDTLVSVRRLEVTPRAILVGVDSLDVDG